MHVFGCFGACPNLDAGNPESPTHAFTSDKGVSILDCFPAAARLAPALSAVNVIQDALVPHHLPVQLTIRRNIGGTLVRAAFAQP